MLIIPASWATECYIKPRGIDNSLSHWVWKAALESAMAEGHTHTPSRVAVKIEGSSGGFSLYNLAKLPSIRTYEDLLLHHDGQGDAVDKQTTVTKITVKVGVPESRRKWYKKLAQQMSNDQCC